MTDFNQYSWPSEEQPRTKLAKIIGECVKIAVDRAKRRGTT